MRNMAELLLILAILDFFKIIGIIQEPNKWLLMQMNGWLI
jgi:hypothetical protein